MRLIPETELLLKKARQVRDQEHRLQPSLRLKTIDEALDFLHSKGIVSVLGGNELPSFISAVLGKPWKPSKKGFTSWLEWWSIKISGRAVSYWTSEIERREDIVGTRIFRKSKTFVSKSLWPILSPIIEHYQELAARHKILSDLEWRILRVLETRGPTRTDRLRSQLRLEGKEFTNKFHRALIGLESFGLIVGYEDPHPERHLHANIWHLWRGRIGSTTKADAGLPYEEAIARLLEKTVDACVLAPEKEIEKWFRWDGQMARAKERLVSEGRIIRAGSFLVTSRVAKNRASNFQPKP